jgi:hypothetical protein
MEKSGPPEGRKGRKEEEGGVITWLPLAKHIPHLHTPLICTFVEYKRTTKRWKNPNGIKLKL